jgi:hypothetical protein
MQQWSILGSCLSLTGLIAGAIAPAALAMPIPPEATWKQVRTTDWETIFIDTASLRESPFGTSVGVIVALNSSLAQASPDVRFVEEIQCQGWRHRTLSINGHFLSGKAQQWVPIARDSTAEAVAQTICTESAPASR